MKLDTTNLKGKILQKQVKNRAFIHIFKGFFSVQYKLSLEQKYRLYDLFITYSASFEITVFSC